MILKYGRWKVKDSGIKGWLSEMNMWRTRTFISSRIDALVQPPLSAAAGHLHYVELAHSCFTLYARDTVRCYNT